MNLLLDTNALLRWVRREVLPRRVMNQIEKSDSLAISIATPWEYTIKIGRHPPAKVITSEQLWAAIEELGARLLLITREHIETLASLPLHHGDPFDRMIIAQAIAEDLTVVSSDERFPHYQSAGLRILWQ